MAERIMACGCWYGTHAATLRAVLTCAAARERARRAAAGFMEDSHG